MQELDDFALLRQYTEQNSEAAFAALVSRHVDKVYSVALRHTRNPHSAEEITQAVFVILARKSPYLGKRVVLSGWLYETSRLTSLTFIRGEIRRGRREQEAYMQNLLNETESDVWPQIAPLLDAAMAGLSEKDRHAVVLRFFDGRSMKEVGMALGASEDAAKMRLNRAVEKLRGFFTKHGVEIPSATFTAAISANSVQAAPVVLAKTATAIAMTKGAAASGSILSLTKGGLKVMAWTKAKAAIVAGSVVLLTAGTGVVTVKAVHAIRAARYPDIQGAWEGIARLEDAGVATGEPARAHVVLKLVKSNGVYTATTDWIEKGLKDVPMGRVVYEYPSLRLERNPRDTWTLNLNANATQMTWDHAIHFIQPDPVLLTRTTTPDTVPEPLAESDFSPQGAADLQGYWKGVIGEGPDALPVDLKIARQADGTFRAEADNPMQGANGQPMTVTCDRQAVELAFMTGAGMFQGRINDAKTEIKGSWIQDGQSFPASVKRADYQAEHAQDAAKDYSFNSDNDLQGHWKGSWVVPIGGVNATIRLALDIAKLPDGSYLAALSNLDEFGHGAPIPASEFQYTWPDLHLEWKWAGNTAFDGKLKKGKLAGNWLQSGGAFPLVFEREK